MNTEILEGNKLIAEFMGYELVGKKSLRFRYWEKPLNDEFGSVDVLCSEDKLLYHSSWDWLMPVVEKMEVMGFGMDITPHDVKVVDYTTGNEEERTVFINDNNYPKVYQIYCTVLDFIKWYNLNQPTK